MRVRPATEQDVGFILKKGLRADDRREALRLGVDPAQAFNVIANTAVCSPFAARSAIAMIMGDFTPQFTTELVAKDFDYSSNAAGGSDLAPTISASQKVFHEAVIKGFGDENLTSVVKLFSH